ncbi:hypothetical protein AB0C34_28885 [Nocardia sp. NPDC049220]|uniref:hypothetical protein n=1 Tax=Nocardia sp. NPDC049220 TaxID=3155273 RepID=UPI00340FD70D
MSPHSVQRRATQSAMSLITAGSTCRGAWWCAGMDGDPARGEEQVIIVRIHAKGDVGVSGESGPPPGEVVGLRHLVVATALEHQQARGHRRGRRERGVVHQRGLASHRRHSRRRLRARIERREVAGDAYRRMVHRLGIARHQRQPRNGRFGGRDAWRDLRAHTVPEDENAPASTSGRTRSS